jgi:hypothetical protein
MVLVIAIAGGIALAALAGARRTDSAVGRFVTYFRPAQGQISAPPKDFKSIAGLPDVAATESGADMLLAPIDRTGRVDHSYVISTLDLLSHLHFSRPVVLAGRLPRANEVNDVVVNPSAALDGHLHVGSTMHLRAFSPDRAQQVLQGLDQSPTGPEYAVRVVGIVRTPSDLSVAPPAPGVVFEGQDEMLFTPAFFHRNGAKVALAGIGMSYRLKGGNADLPSFLASVTRRFGHAVQVQPGSDDLAAAANAQHATHLEALALLLFGILASLLTITMVAQAIARQASIDAGTFPTLRALGMKRAQLAMTGGVRAGLTVLTGTLLAVAIAVLLSPTMPIGLARQAEVTPGFSADWLVLLVGAASLLLILVGWALVTSWRAAKSSSGPSYRSDEVRRPPVFAAWLPHSGLPVTAVLGVRMAFDSRRGSVPVRTTLFSAVVAISAVCAALTFGSSLDRLASQPHLQGWTWDVSVGNPHSDDISARVIPELSGNPDVAGFSAMSLSSANVEFAGRHIGEGEGLFGIRAVKGSVLPPFTEGRAPRKSDEIAFGATTLRELHLHVGDWVTVANGRTHRRLHVSGQMVLTPSVVNDQVPMGHGTLMTLSGLRTLHASAPVNVFLVRLTHTVPRNEAFAELSRKFPGTVLGPLLPPDIENLRRVDGLPTLLVGLVALVALVTIGHGLVVSVRHRRRDLAVLRSMGFLGRDVSALVAWQVTAVVVIGLVVGVPIGIVTGRWAWTLVTNQLGLPRSIAVSALLALVVPVALIAVNAIAFIPGRTASRMRLSSVLRAE